ncbi:MAG: hypothetical protein U9N45_00665 [Gemmatimonadota bacterium]|nr:hypothetical protein [Gemmatimonadota bacterium]
MEILKRCFVCSTMLFCMAVSGGGQELLARAGETDVKIAVVKRYRFPGSHREDSMWSALYGARSGKIYIGLCTHAEAAHFYEFDPATDSITHIADMTVVAGERGKGIRTTGKIHVRMGEDDSGNIYFGGLCEDTGPEPIDPASYPGPHWYRYNPNLGKVEDLGLINRHWGLLGMTVDNKYNCLYGLAEDGHLYKHDINKGITRDLGLVDSWDVCRTVFADNHGNVYGAFPVARIWKYDPVQDRVIDLPNIRLWYDLRVPPRTMTKPMIDRKVIWRVIEWDPVDKVAYGIMGGSSMLFRFDPDDGPEGKITTLVKMCAPQYLESDPMQTPFSTLALTISNDHLIYYAPTMAGSFDYTGISWDVRDEEKFKARLAGGHYPPLSVLVTYNPDTGERSDLGRMKTHDGCQVYGLGGACMGQKDGKIYFVGAIDEPDPGLEAAKVARRWPYSMGLISYDPQIK